MAARGTGEAEQRAGVLGWQWAEEIPKGKARGAGTVLVLAPRAGSQFMKPGEWESHICALRASPSGDQVPGAYGLPPTLCCPRSPGSSSPLIKCQAAAQPRSLSTPKSKLIFLRLWRCISSLLPPCAPEQPEEEKSGQDSGDRGDTAALTHTPTASAFSQKASAVFHRRIREQNQRKPRIAGGSAPLGALSRKSPYQNGNTSCREIHHSLAKQGRKDFHLGAALS